MVELLDTPHKQVQVGVCMLGSLIIILGVLRHFLNTKLPASTVCFYIFVLFKWMIFVWNYIICLELYYLFGTILFVWNYIMRISFSACI
jgi:hypothetical protein